MRLDLQLEQIGLTKSETKVYLSLLKIGASSTGPIIKASKTANSKVYEVLDKLIDKGLVSYYSKGGVNYYKASSPNRILDYLEEKKKEIEKQEKKVSSVLPMLLQLEKEKSEFHESLIYSGPRGIKTAFLNLVDELDKGDEVHIMGVYDFGDRFFPLARFFQKIRSQKGIKAKFLINNNAKKIAKNFKQYPPVQIRFMPEQVFTPAIFLIYQDKVIINLAKELTFFVIKSKSAKEAFDVYFKILWKQAKN
jgi:HTH-type transcriptional regulator, sugar sensing transcriptional regulator